MIASVHRRLVLLLGGVFFLSGFSALLYQVIWQRLLGLFTGSDVRSVTIITGAYLGGLGVGSLIGSAIADRLSSRQAVRAYGLCNIAIALFALASRLFFYDVLFLRLNTLAETPLLMLVTVFASLLIPTTLMGLSLPLLAKALVRSIEGAARLISRLYAGNTLGAGVGALLAGWVLTGAVGYEWALYVGAAISGLVGIVALLAGARFENSDAAPTRNGAWLQNPFDAPRAVWGWCALVFASGFLVISLEIVWFRVLDFTLKSSVYTFGHLLAFFLIGDAIGSLIGARRVARIRNPRRVFLLLQALIALYALGVTWLLAAAAGSRGSFLATYIAAADGRITLVHPLILVILFGALPALVLLPPAIMIGYYFPVVQKAIQTDTQVVGQRVGLVEVANIMGNTAGSILTGTLLLDTLGTPGTLKLVGLLGVLFVLLLLWENMRAWSLRARLAHGGLAAALLLVVVAFPGLDAFWAQMHGAVPGRYFAVAEDSTGISAMREADDGLVNIWANGRSQGDIPFLDWHSFIGALPALVHPDPRSVMVIGVGSAGSPYAVGVNPAIERIYAVELIGSELHVLRRFAQEDARGAAVGALFSDPRYTLVVGDGRREVAISDTLFDAVIIDAVLPWTSHAGLLYSQEFYDVLRARLAADGLVVQWRPTQRSEATFTRAFPYVVLVGEIVMIGSSSPIPYDAAALLARLQDEQVSAYLRAGGTDAASFTHWISAAPLTVWGPQDARPAYDLLTDLFPRDEYYLNNPLGAIRYPVSGVGWVELEG
ncbi:MAG: spermidine synthase [Chloroflexi bacterium]|nr:spermidine synthase [Chloroflexota bacterium]